jgi:hypothetical protein
VVVDRVFACYLYTRDTAWTFGCVPTHVTQASTGLARHLRAFVLLAGFTQRSTLTTALRFNEMEHMLLCLFHASEECHSSRHLPCSASFCSYRGPPVLLQAKVQVGVVCIAAVRDRQSNTLLFSAADGWKTADRCCSATVCNCSQFWATRDDAKLNTSQRILALWLGACRSAANRIRFLRSLEFTVHRGG